MIRIVVFVFYFKLCEFFSQYVNYSTKQTHCPLVSPTNAYTERERLLSFSSFFFFCFSFFFVILLCVRTFFLIILPFLSIHITTWQRFRSKTFFLILFYWLIFIFNQLKYIIIIFYIMHKFFLSFLIYEYNIFNVILNFQWHQKSIL